jgi:hypothetical protein
MAVLLLAQQAQVPSAREYVVLGPGRESCINWFAARAASPAQHDAQVAWLAGYLSAYQQHAPDHEGIITPRTENTDWIELVTQFCQNNPMANLASAANSVVLELRQRRTVPTAR